jgi:hypothetical protein
MLDDIFTAAGARGFAYVREIDSPTERRPAIDVATGRAARTAVDQLRGHDAH